MKMPTETQPVDLVQPTAETPRPDDLAVVIPAYNEERGVASSIEQIREALERTDLCFTIVVVDDGSTDGTADAAEAAGVRVLRLGHNGGYGAALKAGIKATRSTFVAITDADGTYPGERIPDLYREALDVDMVVGARSPAAAGMQAVRRPAKRFLTWLASYLAGTKIPDLNSGLRVVRRSALMRFLPILPSGFSFTTTITLSLLCTEHRVSYVPIKYGKRIGQSKIRAFDFFSFVILVLRAILLFNPLKVFLPAGAIVFLFGLGKLCYDIFANWNLSESAVMAILAAVILWTVGSLADMIARLQLSASDGG